MCLESYLNYLYINTMNHPEIIANAKLVPMKSNFPLCIYW